MPIQVNQRQAAIGGVTAFGRTDFGVGDGLSPGGGSIAAIAIERRGHFGKKPVHFFRLAGDLSFDFQAHQLGFVGHVFGLHTFTEMKFHFTESPLKCPFCGALEAGEDFDFLFVSFDPMGGTHGHIPLDLFAAQACPFE